MRRVRIAKDTALVALCGAITVGLIGGVAFAGRSQASPSPTGKPIKPRPLGPSSMVERNAEWIRGGTSSPYRLVEFMDYECPPCRMMNAPIRKLVDRYGGRLAWGVREFSLPMHQDARPAALLAVAASKQIAYGRVHEALMSAPSLSIEGRRAVARSLRLDTVRVLSEVGEAKRSIAQDEAAAKKLGLEGTPSLILCTPSGLAWLLSSPRDIEGVLSGEIILPSV